MMASPEAMDFLLTRRSRPAKLLTAPAPDREELMRLLTAAARVPDHGKLEPWRFVVLDGRRARALRRGDPGAGGGDRRRTPTRGRSPSSRRRWWWRWSPRRSRATRSRRSSRRCRPARVALSLLNAALAAGWGASWMTGWAAYDRALVEGELGLAPEESVVGLRLSRELRDAAAGPAAAGRGGADHLARRGEPRRRPRPRAGAARRSAVPARCCCGRWR